ncbi:MAG: hypothetical protein F6K48_03175 [Okeania sp. SIO3H1]|nr:hypothetical protein [Okeania sp. SIO3H1]
MKKHYIGKMVHGLGNVNQVLALAARMDPATKAAILKSQQDQKNSEAQGKMEMERLEDAVKKSAITTAVAQAGLTLAINLVPIAGPILSAAAGEILGRHAKRYQNKLKEYGENKMKELQAYVERRQAALNKALSDAYVVAYKRAVPLALSFQPLEFTESEKDEVINMETFGQAFGGLGFIKKLTGKDAYEKGKAEIDRTVKRVRGEIDSMVDPIMAKIKQPGFVSVLTKTLAVEVRNNPTFLKLARQLGAPAPTKYMGGRSSTATGSTPIPTKQTMPMGQGNGTGTSLSSPSATALQTTSDPKGFYNPSQAVTDAVKSPNRFRTIATVGSLAVGAFLLFR